MINDEPMQRLREAIYTYGDTCTKVQSNVYFGRITEEQRNAHIREYGDTQLLNVFLEALAAEIERAEVVALDLYEHRIDCNTAISELYGWRSILEYSKEQTMRLLGLESKPGGSN